MCQVGMFEADWLCTGKLLKVDTEPYDMVCVEALGGLDLAHL